MILTLLVEQPAGPPVREGALDAVVLRPSPTALPQPAVLEQLVDLLVAQDGQAVRRASAPASVAGLAHRSRLHGKTGIGDGQIRQVGGVDRRGSQGWWSLSCAKALTLYV